MDHHQNLTTKSTSSAASAANTADMTSVPLRQQHLQQQEELQQQIPSTSSSVVAIAPTEDTSSASIDSQWATAEASSKKHVTFVTKTKQSNPKRFETKAIAREKIKNRRRTPRSSFANPPISEDSEEDSK